MGGRYDAGMELALVPLIGPFHLRSPAYNAVSVRDLVAGWEPQALATPALLAGDLADLRWQDTPEVALPLAVAPWARRRGVPLLEVGEASSEPGAEEDFRRYLEPYPEMRQRLAQVDALLEPVSRLLQEPLSLDRIQEALLPHLRRYQETREEAFEDGPASGWLRERCRVIADRILDLEFERVALLVPVDTLPFLSDALAGSSATLVAPSAPALTPDSRERSLLDFAFRSEVPDPERLLAQLRELDGAEARYHEANILLANGHGFEALELLEGASRGDFSSPYFLPGYLLARLGQLRDLAGRRDDAVRAYRGVLALDYAPQEAVDAARAGMERPFSPA